MPWAAQSSCESSRSVRLSRVNSRTERRRASASSTDIFPFCSGVGSCTIFAEPNLDWIMVRPMAEDSTTPTRKARKETPNTLFMVPETPPPGARVASSTGGQCTRLQELEQLRLDEQVGSAQSTLACECIACPARNISGGPPPGFRPDNSPCRNARQVHTMSPKSPVWDFRFRPRTSSS